MPRPLRDRKVTPIPRKGRGAKPGHREIVAQRQADAMRLRVAGASFGQIAERLGTSKQQAWRDCRAALAETLEQRDGDAARFRALELARLDALIIACWPHAQKGSAEHVRAVVRISERRARLLGLDAVVASRLEVKGVSVVEHRLPEDRYAGWTTERIMARLDDLRRQLADVVEAEAARALPAGEPDVEPELTPEEAYARELARRRPH